jgi:hypothetical protein
MCVLGARRPVTEDGQRVTPSDLADYRITHQFRAPSCLCGCKTNNASYAETAIYIAKDGPYSGEYVVGCASDSCGYLSKSGSYLNATWAYLIIVSIHSQFVSNVCIQRWA